MATIALKGAFDCGTGIKAFNSLDSSFSRLKTTTKGLTNALGDLITKINTADKAVDKDYCCTAAERSRARESDKNTSLSLAYDKLDELISKAGKVDNAVAEKINSNKDNFYKKYAYLKPSCEKSIGERITNWCKKNITSIIAVATAAIVVAAAVVICVWWS